MYVGVFFALGDTRCVQVGCILGITCFLEVFKTKC